ncbi:MAG TPA: threonine synthase [Gaiellaceae bacterium]|nr:threonine synthase [Gaiellaceae bacterium]
MPATSLRCRNCGHELGLDAVGACNKCWGPLEPVYDLDEIRSRLTRESIAAGPPSLWRYGALLPVETPPDPRLPPGFSPLVQAPRLAEAVGVRELYLKLDTANPTHSFKDRVVAVACAKAQELGLQTLACSSTGNLAAAVAARAAVEGLEAAVFCPGGLEREKLLATAAYGATIYEVLGTYDDCSRLTVELSFELPWAFVNVGLRAYYAEGSKTLAFEVAEQLGWTLPDAVVCPVASGALFSKLGRGFGEFLELGLVEGAPPRLIGAQAQGCDPVAAAYRGERAVTPIRPRTAASSLAIGNPADGDHAVATARASGGSIHSVPEDEIGSNMVLLAESSGVFGEAAAGICLGALREAIAQGTVGADDRVVLLVTGDGLKTPGPVVDRIAAVEIEADADAFLEQLGVAV